MDPFAVIGGLIIFALVIIVPAVALSQDARSGRQDPAYRAGRRDHPAEP